MPASASNFVWYDLMTTDTHAAETFYSTVIGWTARDSGMPGVSYTILSMDGVGIGGVMPLPQDLADADTPPHWTGYVHVSDVDTYAERVTRAGGSVDHPPTDIPGVGRFAVVADPHGAVFILFKDTGGTVKPEIPHNTPGHIGWRELHAGDRETAFAFYAELFGWTKIDTVDMGPMGIYQTFATDGVMNGGMMTKSGHVPRPFWLYYFNVDDIQAGAARVASAGGKVLNGLHPVPGGGWIAHCSDPQGAMFAITGPRL